MDEQPIQDLSAETHRQDEDWPRPKEQTIPERTVWPAALALAAALFAWGFQVSWWISIVGAILGAIAVSGWVRGLVHEYRG